jgi:dethiobiotin synthetase
VAAERQGMTIDFARIQHLVDGVRSRGPDLLIVEGAGGLLVPMGAGRLLIDLVAVLGLPVIVVGRAGLGTINHTLLTLREARGRDLEVAGVVLSASESIDPEFVASNAAEIGKCDPAPVWQMPYLGTPSLDVLTEVDLGFAAELFHVEQAAHDGR